MKEFKDIAGFDGLYQISNDGEVLSLNRECNVKGGHRSVKSRVLKKVIDSRGYFKVTLSKSGAPVKNWLIHRLVALTFIPNPDGKVEVNHIDGDKQNNNVENLEWATRQENAVHMATTGLAASGERHGRHILRKKDVLNIRAIFATGRFSISALAEIFKVDGSTIGLIVNGKTWLDSSSLP